MRRFTLCDALLKSTLFVSYMIGEAEPLNCLVGCVMGWATEIKGCSHTQPSAAWH